MKTHLLSLLLLAPLAGFAENDTQVVTCKGFLDTYYGYDFNEPVSHRRPGFLYNHTTTDAPAVNLALIQADLNGGWYHASLGLMAGTYSRVNLAAEPELLQHFYDTYIGVALNRGRTLWLDVGEFSSHIGFESAVSADNYTLSRSLMAENSPYFLTGGRLTWKPKKEWELAFLVVDGWQRVRPLAGNSLPGFGTKVAWTPHDRLTLNWSTYVGSEFPDDQRRMRYFNNLYAHMVLSSTVSMYLGCDIGWQQRATSGNSLWWSPNVIVRWKPDDRWSTAFRVEQYNDASGVIVSLPGRTALTGLSFNVDRQISKNLLFRVEMRYLRNSTPAFQRGDSLVRSSTSLLASFSIRFS
ncbi:porin [Prosthecobacter sp.]|uniref:porin n=1 Tax=Prosthecobacter sp. TaxID=1965333 RepID=UPI003784C2CB